MSEGTEKIVTPDIGDGKANPALLPGSGINPDEERRQRRQRRRMHAKEMLERLRSDVAKALEEIAEDDDEDDMEKAVWSGAYINDLPDSAFLHVSSGGKKDEDGKTTPRSLRHFPVRDADGKLDLPHLRNALARIPQSNMPQDVKDESIKEAQRLLEESKKESEKESEEKAEKLLGDDDTTDIDLNKGLYAPIIKTVDERREVTAVVLKPEVTDAQGDIISRETIERAQRKFMMGYNRKITKMGYMHKDFSRDIDVVESYITPATVTINGRIVPEGSWVQTVRVGDDGMWAEVKKGVIKGFSIGGVAKVTKMPASS